MDLLSGLRKGGASRGGRAEFSWDSVKEDKDRENYLGHSLMAPVGRWQRGKNLTWYADASSKQSASDARAEEIRRIKEAEQDALAEALGFPVDRRHRDPVDQKEVQKAIRESGVGPVDRDDDGEGQGLGFGRSGMKELMREELRDRVEATDGGEKGGDKYQPAAERTRDGDGRRSGREEKDLYRSRRSSSPDRDRSGRDKDRRHRHRRSRSRSRRRHRHDDDRDSKRHRPRSTSRIRDRRERDDRDGRRERRRSRSRSRSPRRHHRR